MRGAVWMIGLALVACGSGGDDPTTGDSGTPGSTLEDLCDRFPIPQFDNLACPDGGGTDVYNAWEDVYRTGRRCDVAEDCRLTNGYCAQNLQGLEQISVNRCLSDAEVGRYAAATAPCDYRVSCSQNQPTMTGVQCRNGSCEPIIEE